MSGTRDNDKSKRGDLLRGKIRKRESEQLCQEFQQLMAHQDELGSERQC